MKKFGILLSIIFVISAKAQDKKSYSFTLDQAISHALTNNRQAINAGRDIEISKQRKWETTAMGLPQVNGSLGYLNNIKLQKSLIPAEIFGGPAGQFAEVAFGTNQNASASIGVTQLLFDGSYLVALQASKTYLKFFENYKKKTDEDIREMIINSYGSVLLADESKQILEKNKVILEKTIFETTQIYKNGLIEEENVEQLKITLSTINNNLNYISRLKDLGLKMLKINLGIDINSELILSDKLEILAQNNLDLGLIGKTSDFDAKNNINYTIAQNFVQQKTLELKLQKSKALPSLGLGYNLGANSFSQDFNFLSTNQRWFNYSNIGVNLNVPIFSSFGRKAKTEQAKIELDKAKTQLDEAEQKLKLAFDNAKSDYEFSIEQYNSSKESLRLAERIEKKQQIKFKEGLSSSFDLAEAQRQLYTEQQNYLKAMVEVINKKAGLMKIAGK